MIKECTAEYEIDNSSIYNILDKLCKDNDLYTYVKQHKSKRDGKGANYAIHSKWLGPNHVSAKDSEAKLAWQMSV